MQICNSSGLNGKNYSQKKFFQLFFLVSANIFGWQELSGLEYRVGFARENIEHLFAKVGFLYALERKMNMG